MKEPGAILGIDIGGTNTPFGLVGPEGRLRWLESIPTRGQNRLPELVERLFATLEARLAGAPPAERPVALGVGAPNANAYSGRIEAPPNMSWGTVDLASVLLERGGLPLALTNDANAAALGEAVHGAGRGMRHLLVLTLGTGLGSGLIVDGRLLHGYSGLAGEFGHVIVQPGGRLCGCGRRGCLETVVSAGGVVATTLERLAHPGAVSCLRAAAELSPAAIHAAAEAGDALAAEVWAETGRVLGRALADAVALLSPQAIVLCGGVARAGSWLLEPLRAEFEQSLLAVHRGTVKILPSALPAEHAGVLGAAEWARRELAAGRGFHPGMGR
jgi:glucokinase